jgi:hypothetical protein
MLYSGLLNYTTGLFDKYRLILAVLMITGLLSYSNVLAQEQKPEVSQQPQTGTFIMIMELHYSRETASSHPDFVRSQIYNMTTNMKNFNQNNTVEYDVKDIDVTIDDSQIYFRLPFKIVDISTPNVVKTRNGDITVSMPTEDYEKQLNTLTNITSYSGKSSLYINGERFFDVNMKAVLFPNSTGILEITQI